MEIKKLSGHIYIIKPHIIHSEKCFIEVFNDDDSETFVNKQDTFANKRESFAN